MRNSRPLATFALLMSIAPFAKANKFGDWLNARVTEVGLKKTAGASSKAQLNNNLKQIATEKQTSPPSGTDSSPSLLDRTSGPDLVGTALQLAGFGGSNSGSNGDVTVSASAYALYTTFTGQAPLAPEVYNKGINWRRVSITLGTETPQDQMEKDNGKNRIVGAKFLILNNRDVSTVRNRGLVDGIDAGTVGSDFANVLFDTKILIVDALQPAPGQDLFEDKNWDSTLSRLSADQLDKIDLIISKNLVSSLDKLSKTIKSVVRQIRTAPQLSIAYTGKLAEQRLTGIDTHRVEGAFDYGFVEWIGVTLNASFDYLNSRMIGADIRQGRVAGELHFTPRHDQALKQGVSPLTFGLAGEAKWMNSFDSIYKVQARIEIPIAKGISFPISVTRANRVELIKNSEQEIRGQFGFTIDVAKLAGLFGSGK